MSILQRTIKLTLATCLSIVIANWLGLSSFTTSGTIALLSVLETRRDSYRMAFNRFLSSVLALASATLIFWLLGFSIWTFALYLILYVPLAYHFKLAASIAPSTVLVFHVLMEKNISLAFLGNELALLIVGSLVALIINSFMVSRVADLMQEFDSNVLVNKGLFETFAKVVRTSQGLEELDHILEDLDDRLKKGSRLAQIESGNLIFQQEMGFLYYYEIQEQYNRNLKEIVSALKAISQSQASQDQKEVLAQVFERMAEQMGQVQPSSHIDKKIVDSIHQVVEEQSQAFQTLPIPSDWAGFKTHTAFLTIFESLEQIASLNWQLYNQFYSNQGLYADRSE